MPHTHWDREWYEPFQVFRFRLVEVLDDVIERAESDLQFRFTLDGQTAAIEDYLEIRPENTDRVRALVASGRLAVGPWQILLDEFLCSGETIVRNLEMGWRGASALGGAMRVGYLPDMFGHVAQMPQILARAGIQHACLWRGVPAAVDSHAFAWRAPDGSTVRVEYLFDGYGSALDVLAIDGKIRENAAEYRRSTRSRYGDDPVLGMVGTDHMAPDPALMDQVRANSSAELPLHVETLQEYVERFGGALPTQVVDGELRSHARGNILPGVLSIRRPLKQAMALAERTIGEAERVAALWSAQDFEPFYRLAWRRIIESSAHDSVVGSGTDETVAQVQARLEEAAQIARAVRDSVLGALAADVPSDAYLVVNTVPVDRTVTVELEVPAPHAAAGILAMSASGDALPVQEVGFAPTALGDERLDAADFDRILHRIHGRELFGQQIDGYRIDADTAGGPTIAFEVAEVPTTAVFDVTQLGRELEAAARQRPGAWRVTTTAQARRRVLVDVPVSAMGTAAFRVGQGERGAVTAGDVAAVVATERTLDNGIVSVRVDDDGTFSFTGADGTELDGVGRIVDGGDRGDSYNYGPPANDRIVDAPASASIELTESGPVRGVITVKRVYDWPVGLGVDGDDDVRCDDERSAQRVATEVTMVIELRRGEPLARLRLSFVNQSRDHRVRLHVPLPAPSDTSASDGQFAVTERGLTGEGGWGEFPIPTFPAYGFASAGDATVLVKHATEYELTDGRELAITLARTVGSISVNEHPLRDEPAASVIAIPGAQELGTAFTAELAIMADHGGWSGSRAIQWGEHFRAEPLVARGTAAGDVAVPAPATGIRVEGDDVVLSSLRRVAGGREVRLVAMSAVPTVARVVGDFTSATRTDLLGRDLSSEAAPGVLDLRLGPWEIATVRLA
jgi:alpha-mannosidase